MVNRIGKSSNLAQGFYLGYINSLEKDINPSPLLPVRVKIEYTGLSSLDRAIGPREEQVWI